MPGWGRRRLYMNKYVAELIELLALERLEENLFRGPSRDIGTNRVFGGQVLGQAIKAAQYTVNARVVHSLHAYFLREGDHKAPIVYDVDRSRDGRSFSARRVVAIQHGRPIFTLSASFQGEEEGVEHQPEMPEVPPPEDLADILTYSSKALPRMPEKLQRIMRSTPFDFKPVEPIDIEYAASAMPRTHLWLRIPERLPVDDDLHRSMLAYASDYGLLRTALLPHRLHLDQSKLTMASLDHAMWFHRRFRIDQWLLYVCESPTASSARGLARGSFFTRDGVLVASTAQEGLIRLWPDEDQAT